MNKIRVIIIGVMAGGALGAKTAAFISSLLNFQGSFQLIETGLILGVSVGFILSIMIVAGEFLKLNQNSTTENLSMNAYEQRIMANSPKQ